MKWLQEFFTFRKGERKAILLLTVLIGIVLLANFFTDKYLVFTARVDFSGLEEMVAALNQNNEHRFDDFDQTGHIIELSPVLYEFDPNKLEEEGFVELGLPLHIARRIVNFRNSGGRFYKKEDFGRIYGMRQEDIKRLYSYMVFEEILPTATLVAAIPEREEKKGEAITVNINTADSMELLKIKGIGPVFSSRIIRFRDRLGGFHNIEQLLEVYGVDSNLYLAIKPQLAPVNTSVVKINVNTAEVHELVAHPYINWQIARAIVNYRNANGNYGSLTQLKDIYFINDSIFKRISPYLHVE